MAYCTGVDQPLWKGDEVAYRTLHAWVARHKGRPAACSHCGANGRTDWANVSGEYLRDLDDYIALCRRCHKAFDGPTECQRGHPFDEANTIIRKDGRRRCRACTREQERRRYRERQ